MIFLEYEVVNDQEDDDDDNSESNDSRIDKANDKYRNQYFTVGFERLDSFRMMKLLLYMSYGLVVKTGTNINSVLRGRKMLHVLANRKAVVTGKIGLVALRRHFLILKQHRLISILVSSILGFSTR